MNIFGKNYAKPYPQNAQNSYGKSYGHNNIPTSLENMMKYFITAQK